MWHKRGSYILQEIKIDNTVSFLLIEKLCLTLINSTTSPALLRIFSFTHRSPILLGTNVNQWHCNIPKITQEKKNRISQKAFLNYL